MPADELLHHEVEGRVDRLVEEVEELVIKVAEEVVEIRRMVAATEPPTIQNAILKAGVLTDEAVRNGSLKKSGEKIGNGEEPSKERNVKGDNKRARTEKVFATITNPVRKEYTGSTPKKMDQDATHMLAASKVSMLKPEEFEIWRMRIDQYIQMIDYSLWDVIENGEARIWLDKEPPRSILTWEDFVSKFINHFFPPSKTTYLQNEITNFLQKPNETFNEAWERFKDFLRQCPHHGFSELHQLDTFYNALNPNDQDALDSAAGGNFLDKIPRECLSIIESKSKVRYSRSRITNVRANINAPLSSSSPSNSFDLQQIDASLED
nr:reverse transcriptase domain-containing protein [Tanacetum cinerariifolium]